MSPPIADDCGAWGGQECPPYRERGKDTALPIAATFLSRRGAVKETPLDAYRSALACQCSPAGGGRRFPTPGNNFRLRNADPHGGKGDSWRPSPLRGRQLSTRNYQTNNCAPQAREIVHQGAAVPKV